MLVFEIIPFGASEAPHLDYNSSSNFNKDDVLVRDVIYFHKTVSCVNNNVT